MSHEANTLYIEGLYSRLEAYRDRISVYTAEELDNLIQGNDFESAEALLDTVEALYADDL